MVAGAPLIVRVNVSSRFLVGDAELRAEDLRCRTAPARRVRRRDPGARKVRTLPRGARSRSSPSSAITPTTATRSRMHFDSSAATIARRQPVGLGQMRHGGKYGNAEC